MTMTELNKPKEWYEKQAAKEGNHDITAGAPLLPVTDKQVHVYAQTHEHGDAFIVGSTNGLKALRDAIDRALNGEVDSVVGMMASDGEGYNLFIATEDKPFMWDQLQMPYTDELMMLLRDPDELMTLRDQAKSADLHPIELILKYDQLSQKTWKDDK